MCDATQPGKEAEFKPGLPNPEVETGGALEVEEKLREGGGQAAAGELGHSRSAPGRTGVGGHARPAHAGTARVFSEARRSRGRTGKTQDFVWSPPVPAKSKACGEERQGSSASLRWRVSENAEHVR